MAPVSETSPRANAEDALRWADRFMVAAGELANAGLYDRATSQLYYAGFHCVRGLLFTRGLEPRSHTGLRSLFRHHFAGE